MAARLDLPGRTVAGTPTASAPAGISIRLGTTALAPTVAPVPMIAWWRTTDPEPTSVASSSVQPSRWARWPITHPSPTTVGNPGPAWTTVPSCTDVRAPMTMAPWSPRRTAHGQTVDSAPMVTSPITPGRGGRTPKGRCGGSGHRVGRWAWSDPTAGVRRAEHGRGTRGDLGLPHQGTHCEEIDHGR